MKVVAIILLAFAAMASVVSAETELKVVKTFVPENCSRESKSGDHLYMHYSKLSITFADSANISK